MFKKLLIFLNSGLLLFKKSYSEEKLNGQEDLASGFFSAIIHYFADQKFGEIRIIKTDRNVIFIRKVRRVYLTLIVSLFERNDSLIRGFSESIDFLNRRINVISQNMLNSIERKVSMFLLKNNSDDENLCPNDSFFSEIENEIDEIIITGMCKINKLEKIVEFKTKIPSHLYNNY